MQPRALHRDCHQRRGTIYVAVVGVAVIVGVVGLASIEATRVERLRAVGERDRLTAQSIAQSSVECAISRITIDPLWRATFQHGVEYTMAPSSIAERFTFRLLDLKDGNLANNSNDPISIEGIGRWRDATCVYRCNYGRGFESDELVGPLLLGSFDAGSAASTEAIDRDKWLAQYVQPALPPGAVKYCVTEVDVLARRSGTDTASLHVRIYAAQAGAPSSLIESQTISSSQLASSYQWRTVAFTQVVDLPVGQGVCVALEGTGSSKVDVQYEGGNVVQNNNHMVRGSSGSWTSIENDKALYYRVRGCYTTTSGATGEFQLVPGSWQRVAAP